MNRQAILKSLPPWREDDLITMVPKFKIKEGQKEAYMKTIPKFLSLVKENEVDSCVFYGFVGPTEDGHIICREGYNSAEGLIKHLNNIDEVLTEALKYSDLVDCYVQGPAAELEKLKEPLKSLNPQWYPCAQGSFRSNRN